MPHHHLIAKPNFKGEAVRAWLFRCGRCYRDLVMSSNVEEVKHLLLATAEMKARHFEGWAKTKDGWTCDKCMDKADRIKRGEDY